MTSNPTFRFCPNWDPLSPPPELYPRSPRPPNSYPRSPRPRTLTPDGGGNSYLGRAGARGPPPPTSLTGRPFLNGRGHCGEATLEESREQTFLKTFHNLCENLIGPGELRRSYVGRVAGRTPSVLVWAFRSALFVSWRPLRATWVSLGSLVGSLGATWGPRGASRGRSWGPLG